MTKYVLPRGYLSYSQVWTYLICGKRYEFVYIKQVEHPVYEEAYLGGAFHKGQETYFKEALHGNRLTDGDIAAVFARFFNEGWSDEEGRATIPDQVRWENSRATVYDNGIEISRLYTAKLGSVIEPLDVETPFRRQLGDIPIVGRIDLVERSGRIIDWKTRKRRLSQNEAQKSLQPSLYAIGSGGPVKFAFHAVVRAGKAPFVEPVESDRGVQDIALASEVVQGVAKAISQGDFPLNPTSNLCSAQWCPYWSICVGRYRK